MKSSNFFRQPGARSVLWGLAGLLALTVVNPVFAQGRALKDVDQRLQRVERVLDQSLLELLQEVESLKREIRRLRGELESQANQLEKMQNTNRDLYLDTDQRLGELERGDSSGLTEPGLDDAIDTGGAGLQEPPDPDTGTDSGTTTGKVDRAEKAAYAKAYDLLASGKNPAAIESFKEFLRVYPDGDYSDNAWYWQGEAMYAQRQFDQAIANFLQVIDFFPGSRKVPDAKLKIGFAQFESGKFKEARETLTAVREEYPGRSASVLARRRLEAMDAEGQ